MTIQEREALGRGDVVGIRDLETDESLTYGTVIAAGSYYLKVEWHDGKTSQISRYANALEGGKDLA